MKLSCILIYRAFTVLMYIFLFCQVSYAQVFFRENMVQKFSDENDISYIISKQKYEIGENDPISPYLYFLPIEFQKFYNSYNGIFWAKTPIKIINCEFSAIKNPHFKNQWGFSIKSGDLKITHSRFYSSGTFANLDFTDTVPGSKYAEYSTLDIFRNLIDDVLSFTNVKGKIRVFDNIIKTKKISLKKSNLSIQIAGNNRSDTLRLQTNANTDLKISNYDGSDFVYYNGDNLDSIKIQKNFIFDSYEDSIGLVQLLNKGKSHNRYSIVAAKFGELGSLTFASDKTSRTYLEFLTCTFAKKIDIEIENLDTLRIYNSQAKEGVRLTIKATNKPMAVNIDATDLSNWDFEFLDNMTLYFDKELGVEGKHSLFTGLREKFAKEGKPNSYRNVDILYKQFQYEQKGLVGRIVSKIDDWWWHYGYAKDRILLYYDNSGTILLFGQSYF